MATTFRFQARHCNYIAPLYWECIHALHMLSLSSTYMPHSFLRTCTRASLKPR